MKKQIINTAVLFIITMVMVSCGNNHSENKKENTTTGPTENTKYQCPMKCEGDKTYDQPGQCPKCNMDLEQAADTTAHEH